MMAAQTILKHLGQVHFLHQAQEQRDIIDSLMLQQDVCGCHAYYAMKLVLSVNPSAKEQGTLEYLVYSSKLVEENSIGACSCLQTARTCRQVWQAWTTSWPN